MIAYLLLAVAVYVMGVAVFVAGLTVGSGIFAAIQPLSPNDFWETIVVNPFTPGTVATLLFLVIAWVLNRAPSHSQDANDQPKVFAVLATLFLTFGIGSCFANVFGHYRWDSSGIWRDAIVIPNIAAVPTLLGVILILIGVRQIKNAESDNKINEIGISVGTMLRALFSPLRVLLILFPMKGRRARPGEIEYVEKQRRKRGAQTGTHWTMVGLGLIVLNVVYWEFVLSFALVLSLGIGFLFSDLGRGRITEFHPNIASIVDQLKSISLVR